MTKLKDFVDFAYSLVNMEEVKKGEFPNPKEITFQLDKINHALVQREIHELKNPKEEFQHSDIFELDIIGINFKFIENDSR